VKSIKGTSMERLRERLIATGVLKLDGDRVIFQRDQLFESPSTAATAVLGRSANGWKEWKLKDGRTLNEVHRRGIED
jgi:hypothetical protein